MRALGQMDAVVVELPFRAGGVEVAGTGWCNAPFFKAKIDRHVELAFSYFTFPCLVRSVHACDALRTQPKIKSKICVVW